MQFNVCIALLFLCAAVIQAAPAPKIVEKKSLAEDGKAEIKEEDLGVKETGEDKDRSKKSAFYVQIESGLPQSGQLSFKDNQLTVQKIPLALQAQQFQTLNVVQSAPQTLPQTSVMVPQQMVQPVHTLQIVQPPSQPCPQSIPAVNIIQSVPQSTIIKQIQKPKPKPKPTSAPFVPEKPARIEQLPEPLPEPQETLTVLPVAPPCHEHLMLVPETDQSQLAALLQVPSMSPCSNSLHSILGSSCTCQQNIGVQPTSIKTLPLASYSSAYAKSPLLVPYDSMASIPENDNVDVKLGPQRRTHHHTKVILPQHTQQTIYQNMYVRGLGVPPISPYITPDLVDRGITINVSPHAYRDAAGHIHSGYKLMEGSLADEENPLNSMISEANDSIQNKVPREINSNQLLPEAAEETEQENGNGLLIDGRRNARSNKENTNEIETKSKALS